MKKEIDALYIGEKWFTLENTDFQGFFSEIVEELNHRCSVYEIKDESKSKELNIHLFYKGEEYFS